MQNPYPESKDTQKNLVKQGKRGPEGLCRIGSHLQLQHCPAKRANLRSRMVVGSPGWRAKAELLLFLGRGPLHRGVLQQLMHTEFSFPGEQKD